MILETRYVKTKDGKTVRQEDAKKEKAQALPDTAEELEAVCDTEIATKELAGNKSDKRR